MLLIVLPLMRILSTSSWVRPASVVDVAPRATSVVPKVTELLSSCELDSDPILTAPFDTEKSFVLNDAIPFVVVVASSIATSPEVTVNMILRMMQHLY